MNYPALSILDLLLAHRQHITQAVEMLHVELSGKGGHSGAFHDCPHPNCRRLQDDIQRVR
jgi:DNA-binding cell septation regulator SpoVG